MNGARSESTRVFTAFDDTAGVETITSSDTATSVLNLFVVNGQTVAITGMVVPEVPSEGR
jgi:hypothetical protein